MFSSERQEAERSVMKGMRLGWAGEADSALREFENALKIYDRLGDARGKANCFNKIGNLHSDRQNFLEALPCFLEGLAIHEKLGEHDSTATAMVNVAGALEQLGRGNDAAKYYEAALAVAEQLPPNLGRTWLLDAARGGMKRIFP